MVAVGWAGAGAADAQPRPPAAAGSPPRLEVSLGGSFLGGYDLGARDATLTGNRPASGERVVLFRTVTDVGSSGAFEARLGWRMTQVLVAEAGFSYAQPTLRTHVSGDFEQATGVVATDTIAQYVIEGALAARLTRMAFARGRAVPFVVAGAGYLRQLAESDRVVQTGAIFHGGGGLLWHAGVRPRGRVRAYGLRADARINWRRGGVDLDDEVRAWPSVGASVFLRF